jgi:hypothetical protein
MGQFRVEIVGISGAHGCDRRAVPGEKLHARCGKFTCVDCVLFDVVQQLRQKGISIGRATFTHYPGEAREVVDDIAKNTRASGQF